MNVLSKIFVLAVACLFLFSVEAEAQWTCRSKLSSQMKPFHKDFPLKWGIEGTLGQGMMNDRDISNAMIFFGLDYSFGRHQFYFEGGRKAWRNTLDKRNDAFFNSSSGGIREGYYKFFGTNTKLTAGFQQFLAGDYFLVNERAAGINLKQNLGRFDIDINAASVLKDFSRFGSFCSVHYLYNVVRDRHYPYIGEDFGDSNFASATIKYTPSKSKRAKKSKDEQEDGFEEFEDFSSEESSDEFEEFEDFGEGEDADDSDEFEDFEEVEGNVAEDEFADFDIEDPSKEIDKGKFKSYLKEKLIDEVGMVFYSEFGYGHLESSLWLGPFIDFALPKDFSLKSELLYQTVSEQQILLYHFKLSKAYRWKKGNRTSFSLGYFGKADIDENVLPAMSFSNLFIGEVMRMDVYDMPLYQLAVKHNFPKIRLHIKLQSVAQFNEDEISEINLAIGKTFFKGIKLTGMFSQMEANSLNETFYMGRLELRVTI